MEALVLEETHKLRLGEIPLNEPLGPRDVRIDIKTVGICGSDIHYYQHGRIGPFVVQAPMVLGHEASGVVSEAGEAVFELKPGDRVCMEPGIPDPNSRASRLGMYNLDPAVRFWATPPVHGILRPSVVHPADYTFKIPDSVSFAEAAMVEPLAVGMQAAKKAQIVPGGPGRRHGRGTHRHGHGIGGACGRVQPGHSHRHADAEAGTGARHSAQSRRSMSCRKALPKSWTSLPAAGARILYLSAAARHGRWQACSSRCGPAAAPCWWGCPTARLRMT